MKHRWPNSIHSQIEAVFHSIRSIREEKLNSPLGIYDNRGYLECISYAQTLGCNNCCKIRSTLDTQSGLSWTPNPEVTGHPIRF